jgi:DNA-binding NtrC family response regulator
MEEKHILVVDDDSTDADLIALAIKRFNKGREGPSLEIHQSNDLASFTLALKQDGWDAIVADYALPDIPWPMVVELIKKYAAGVPLIMISGHSDEPTYRKMMQAGAVEFVNKNDIRRLGPVLLHVLAHAKAFSEMKEAHAQVSRFPQSTDNEEGTTTES